MPEADLFMADDRRLMATDRQLTYRIDADPADHEIKVALGRACRAAGMSRDDRRADRHLLLLTNANATSAQALHQALSRYPVPPIAVFGCSLPVSPDDPSVRRYQWIDFRRQTLGPGIAGQLAGRTLAVDAPVTAPASPGAFRAPIEVSFWALTLKPAVGFFSLIAISDLYRHPPNGGIGLARIAFAVMLAIGLGTMSRVIIRRQTWRSTLTRYRLVISAAGVLFGILSLLTAQIWMISKIFSALLGFGIPVILLPKDDLRTWMPSENAPLPRRPAVPPGLIPQLPLIFIAIKIACSLLRYIAL